MKTKYCTKSSFLFNKSVQLEQAVLVRGVYHNNQVVWFGLANRGQPIIIRYFKTVKP